MPQDIEDYATPSIEENIEMMDVVESDESIEDILQDAVDTFNEEDEFDPDKAIADMDIDNLTMVELNLQKKNMVNTYKSSKELLDVVTDMLSAVDDMKTLAESTDEFEAEAGKANLENIGTVTTTESYQTFIAYLERQLAGYQKVIDALDARISVKNEELNTTSKAHEDVCIASDRMLAKLGEINASNANQARILNKMKDAYSPEYNNEFLLTRSNTPHVYIPHAKKAVQILFKQKKDVSVLTTELVRSLNREVNVSEYVKEQKVDPAKLILTVLLDSMMNVIDSEDVPRVSETVEMKQKVGTILLYTAIMDWLKVLEGSKKNKKGNAAYIRVIINNILDVGMGIYDGDKDKLTASLTEILTNYYKGIVDSTLPKACFK